MEKHYADLKAKKFFPSLISYMVTGPVCAMVWEGDNAVLTGRKMLGATMPRDSEPGTIRGDLCIDVGRNICHGSDAVESANHEIALWFTESELNAWNRGRCCGQHRCRGHRGWYRARSLWAWWHRASCV